MGGGGSNRQTTTTTQQIPPELRGAYREGGALAEDLIGQIGGILPGYLEDTTVQGVAGPTGIENLAYQQQQGLMESQGPQAWQDALGMFGALGNLPSYGGVDLSGIQGWGQNPISGIAPPAPAPGRRIPDGRQGAPQALAGKLRMQPDQNGGGGGGGEPYDPTGSGGYDPTGGGQPVGGGGGTTPGGIDPSGPGGSAFEAPTPGGGVAPPWTQATPGMGISAPGMGQGPGGGSVREIEGFDMAAFQPGGAGGGRGGGSFSYSSGGGAPVAGEERIGDVLSEIDFANHPALASALETFAATALPGIENSMIGAGLGRSGAAANAISTGKAQMALPVMQQLIQGELTQRGQDVTQRGQDVQANIASAQAAAQARAQGASLQQQRYMADLAHAQVMRGQDIGMRAQDIGLRQQDINAMLAQGEQGLTARGQDIGAMLSGAQGLSSLGGADLARIQQNIAGGMDMGSVFRNIANQQGEAEFLAGQRGGERAMDIFGPILSGAMGSGGTTTSTVGGGGGK